MGRELVLTYYVVLGFNFLGPFYIKIKKERGLDKSQRSPSSVVMKLSLSGFPHLLILSYQMKICLSTLLLKYLIAFFNPRSKGIFGSQFNIFLAKEISGQHLMGSTSGKGL